MRIHSNPVTGRAGMRRRRWVAQVALSALALTALAGCAPAEPQVLAPVEREIATGADDRPIDEVRTASALIDPCALLDTDLARAKGITAPPEEGLFTCVLDGHVIVTTYVEHGQEERFWQERFTIGGAVAYRSSPQLETCDILLPTSFGSSIRFSQHDVGAPYSCVEPEEFAVVAAEKLQADPQALVRQSNGGDGVVACDLFEAAIGETPEGSEVRTSSPTGGDGLDSCGLWAQADTSGAEPGDPLSSLHLTRRPPMPLFSSDGGWEKYEKEPILGREVLYWTDAAASDSGCMLVLDAWASYEREGDVVGATVSARSCADAEELVTKLIPAFRSLTVSNVDTTGLLYGSDQLDSPAPGACVDAVDQASRQCTPFVETEVPDTAVERISQGAVDPDVLCGAAKDSVRALLGDELVPVTVVEHESPLCEFVTPRHSLVVRIAAFATPLSTSVSEADQDIAGHPAHIEIAASGTRRTAMIALTEHDRPGFLTVDIRVAPDRQEGLHKTSAIDDAPLEHFEPLVARITRDLLRD